MKLDCHHCNKRVDTILKMGGLICEECRIILKWPHEPEWQQVFHEKRIQHEKELQNQKDDETIRK